VSEIYLRASEKTIGESLTGLNVDERQRLWCKVGVIRAYGTTTAGKGTAQRQRKSGSQALGMFEVFGWTGTQIYVAATLLPGQRTRKL